MKIRNLLAGICLGLVVVAPFGAEVAEAARAGIRMSPRISAPRPRTTAPKKGVSRPNQSYKPSQKASDIQKNAPKTNAKSNIGTTAPRQSGTRWGNVMRGLGFLAGGMMLGSLLSHLFGFGGAGFMADLLGLVANVFIIYAVISLIKMAYNHFTGKKDTQSVHRPARDEIIEEKYEEPIEDIRPSTKAEAKSVSEEGTGIFAESEGYNAKRVADIYRNM